MKATVSQICELVEGRLVGPGDAVVTGVAGLKTAGPGDVTFARKEYLKAVPSCRATAVLVPEAVEGASAAQIVVPNPYLTFGKILFMAEKEQRAHPTGIHPTAVMGEGVQLGKDVALGAHAVIGEHSTIGDRATVYPNTTIGAHCAIGADTILYSNVAVREWCRIGSRTVIHTCTSIGGDGFGYLQLGGKHVKIPQVGTVEIGDDVEIGCNCTIDRATMEKTVVGNGVKIDNHSHLAHNVQVGDNSMLIAYAGVGGSTVIGKNVLVLEDVGITNNITIGDNTMIGAGSKVLRSCPPGSRLLGAPAQDGDAEKRLVILIKKLPRLYETVRKLQESLEQLSGKKPAKTDEND